MYHNIPEELRVLRQWVGFTIEIVDGVKVKTPVNPVTRGLAKVTDSRTWGTFEQAANCGVPYVAFVLTKQDPYVFIDLDPPADAVEAQRHSKIYELFQSYTELSASGLGVHIICRGSVPAGRRRNHVELYDNERFVIFTGNVLRDLPINDQQPLIDILHQEISRDTPIGESAYVDRPSRYTDAQLCEVACSAVNADKVLALCRGDWQGMYPSQSEADFALLSMFAFYSPDNEQVRRVFRMTELGKRPKATLNDKYINRALAKIRSKELPPVDFTNMPLTLMPKMQGVPNKNLEDEPDEDQIPATANDQLPLDYSYPPGVVGEIARYVEGQAIRPVKEIAMCAALAFTAGLIGRSFNVSGSGLNQYMIIVAPTGTGKEAAATGINRLFAALRPHVPSVDNFMGPGVFASGQALIRVLDEKRCFVSTLGEFGLTLQAWSQGTNNPTATTMRRVLLDIFGKSGQGQTLMPTAYSDQEKNTKMVQSPSLTILGETTPEAFYDNLNAQMISEGLIPRFSIVEYRGERPNRNFNMETDPNPELLRRLMDLAAIGLYTMNNHSVAHIAMEPDAEKVFAKFDLYADDHIRGSQEVERQLWNRAHLKALKLAGLLAAADAPHQPVINVEQAMWAVQFVRREIKGITGRFKAGEVGNSEVRHEQHVRELVAEYLAMDAHKRIKQYGVTPALANTQIIPFGYLRKRMRRLSHFTADKRGAAKAIDAAIEDMLKAGVLAVVNPAQGLSEYGTRTPLYVIGAGW